MARRGSKRRSRHRFPPGRFLLRWLAVAVVGFVAFLYSQRLRSYLSTRHALDSRAQAVRSLRAEKQHLQHLLAEAAPPAALIRAARSLGHVKPGGPPFVLDG